MPEPTSTAATTLIAASATVPTLAAFGVPLGLRPDVLIAGFAGSLVAIILLNSVPSVDGSLVGLLRSTTRRMAVAFASSLTAGYLTPIMLMINVLPDPLLLGVAFVVGGGAQRIYAAVINRFSKQTDGGVA